ncbi:MAG: MBL fold metallo-hydrolase [Clostridiales bacterium]|nr:MBL fold metallo-hydrolase [Clostridiales bacterium]
MKLTALRYGTTHLGENWIFIDGDPKKKYRISLLFFLLEIDEKKYLVDVGCDTMPGFDLVEHTSPINVLSLLKIKGADIDGVILSHTHHDHVDGIRYYENATIYVHESEKEIVRKLAPNNNITTFSSEFKIAENVVIKHIGGHSAGSSVVEIKTDKTTFVLCGDESYHRTCFSTPNLAGGSRNRERTNYFYTEYSKPCYTTILFHDDTIVEGIGIKVLHKDN